LRAKRFEMNGRAWCSQVTRLLGFTAK
jgi:hypothetical protein